MRVTIELLFMNYRAMLASYTYPGPPATIVARAAMPGGVASSDPDAFISLDRALREHGMGALLGMTFETKVEPDA